MYKIKWKEGYRITHYLGAGLENRGFCKDDEAIDIEIIIFELCVCCAYCGMLVVSAIWNGMEPLVYGWGTSMMIVFLLYVLYCTI